MWGTENPWPPIFLLLCAAVLALARFAQRKERKYLLLAGGLIFSTGLALLLDEYVVTPREQVELQARELVSAFQRREASETLAFFSRQVRPAVVPAQARVAMFMVQFPHGIEVKDFSVKLTREETQAVSRFRANSFVSYMGGEANYFPTRWQFTWQLEQGAWKIVRVQRLDPTSDSEISLFHPLGDDFPSQ